MRSSDYSKRSSKPWRGRRESNLFIPIGIMAMILVGLLALGTTLFVKSRSTVVPTDATTLCPTNRPPAEIDVVVLDVSDTYSDAQRVQVGNQLIRVRDRIPRFGLVEVYSVDREGRRLAEPLTRICNPGTGEDLDRLYQNPTLARRRWNTFAATLAAAIDTQIAAPGVPASPILEAIQAVSLRTFGRPEFDRVPKRLVIVSDMIQNVPGRLSMYNRLPAFEAFARTPYYSQTRADLTDVSVVIYYLARPDVLSPDRQREQLAFWNAYLAAAGARVERVEHVFGER
jgi:hypothetical protein